MPQGSDYVTCYHSFFYFLQKKIIKSQIHQEQDEGSNNTIPDEGTTDQLITVLAERVTSGEFYLDISRELRIKVISLHETTIFSDQELVEWCR